MTTTQTSFPSQESNGNIDWKVLFLVALAAFLQIFLEVIFPLLPLLFPDSSYARLLLSQTLFAYASLLAPAIIFVTLYRLYSKQLLERISGIITAIVLGSAIGGWLGSIAGTTTVPLIFPNLSVSIGAEPLLFATVFDVTVGCLAFSARYIVEEWDAKLEQAGLMSSSPTPTYASLIALIYSASGIIILGILPFILFLQILQFTSGIISTLILFIPILLVNCSLEVLIGYGVFRGRRWGWILALLGSVLGVVFTANLVYSLITTSAWVNSLGQVSFLGATDTIAALSALLLNILLLALLTTKPTRLHCRMINPTRQALPSQST